MTAEDFNNEVLPLKHKIFRFAHRLMAGQVEAEDITQDVLVKLWTKKESLNTYRSIEALAMTITRNMCFDKLRSAKRNPAELTDVNAPSADVSPLKRTELNDSVALMQTIVNRLPEKQRMMVQLRDIEGYELKEIAAVCDMTTNAVKVNLSRARQRIREELKNAFEYGLNTH